jgi:PA14 domain
MRFFLLAAFLVTPIALHAESVSFSPGCLAKIYVIGNFPLDPEAKKKSPLMAVTEKQMKGLWPIVTLPDGPVEILRLPQMPTVAALPISKLCLESEQPNHLVESKTGILTNVNVYAVEFEGYFLAAKEGIYTFGAISDDPVEIYVEGNKIAESTFAADLSDGPRIGDNAEDLVNEVDVKANRVVGTTSSTQGSVKLAPGRWYAVTIVARQRWMAAYHFSRRIDGSPYWSSRDANRGACLAVTASGPDGMSGPLKLSLPNVK